MVFSSGLWLGESLRDRGTHFTLGIWRTDQSARKCRYCPFSGESTPMGFFTNRDFSRSDFLWFHHWFVYSFSNFYWYRSRIDNRIRFGECSRNDNSWLARNYFGDWFYRSYYLDIL